jgi:hypothetical protein
MQEWLLVRLTCTVRLKIWEDNEDGRCNVEDGKKEGREKLSIKGEQATGASTGQARSMWLPLLTGEGKRAQRHG